MKSLQAKGHLANWAMSGKKPKTDVLLLLNGIDNKKFTRILVEFWCTLVL